MPIGHPYCTANRSEPMTCCSSRGRDLTHSRTGSRPAAVLKNTTRSRDPSPIVEMYHSWCALVSCGNVPFDRRQKPLLWLRVRTFFKASDLEGKRHITSIW